ncbi:hypothetical protein [Chroococcidiopsis sp. SAG 2025]|nr:hypothetical protein [Chroococcidiopsis sp. SAG 2025]
MLTSIVVGVGIQNCDAVGGTHRSDLRHQLESLIEKLQPLM